jgi:hypothetical protein
MALLGTEIAVTGLGMMLIPAYILLRVLRGATPVAKGYVAGRAVLASLSCLPFVICGVLLVAGAPGALYWMVPGVIVSLLATVLNAWVLLVEILR